MEFACGFVYVPPVNPKDCQQASATRRSALLPPVNRIRPSTPPPPPPTTSAEAASPRSVEQQESSKVEKAANPANKNVGFYQNLERGPVPPPRRTALLPPHMKSAASSRPFPDSLPLNDQTCAFELPNNEPASDPQTGVPDPEVHRPAEVPGFTPAPALPPRPSFLSNVPEYLVLIPSRPHSPSSASQTSPSQTPADNGPLQGNPNVVLVSLGKLLSEERGPSLLGEPTTCSQCGSVLDSCYHNVVNACHFCQWSDSAAPPSIPPSLLFSLGGDETPRCGAADALLLFCIDISGSMSITSKVSVGEHSLHRSRLQFVQEAVMLCVKRLSEQQPDIRVGLITFNNQVMLHGYDNFTSHVLSGADLIDGDHMKEAAATFPTPPPLSQTRDFLQRQVMGLSESGTTALGPAALLTIAMASRQPGSKVIICTDGKANTDLGNLEVEDNDARTLLSSTIFYQELGEYAADQGVTVSVLSIEGTDCRLDELGRLADRTGGKVVIASPNRLQLEFDQIIENRTIATHCSVTLLLPKSLRMRGEREAGHRGIKEVGNVAPETEITFQFGASQRDPEGPPPAPGSRVSIQLQIRYRQGNGEKMLRVITSNREVTNDSSAALSSLSLAIIQLNSSQAGAALAVRGRFLDARREGEQQRKLMESAIAHNHSAQDEQTYNQWVKTMEPIYSNIHCFTRRQSVITDSQRSLTDAGAALLYTMKHSNRKSICLKDQP